MADGTESSNSMLPVIAGFAAGTCALSDAVASERKFSQLFASSGASKCASAATGVGVGEGVVLPDFEDELCAGVAVQRSFLPTAWQV